VDVLPSSRPPFPSWVIYQRPKSDGPTLNMSMILPVTNNWISFSPLLQISRSGLACLTTLTTTSHVSVGSLIIDATLIPFSPRLHSRMNDRRRSDPSSSKYRVRAVDTDIMDKIIKGLIKVPVSKLPMEHNRRQSSPQ
jgi:hypothetical protein